MISFTSIVGVSRRIARCKALAVFAVALLSTKPATAGPVYVFSTLAGAAEQAGSDDGTGALARFNSPWHLAVDASGNVYVADTGNHTIRKVSPSGQVTTLAGSAGVSGSVDGKGSSARFSSPRGIAVDAAGTVYVADSGNSTIRKISPEGDVTTFAGTASPTGGGHADGAGAAAGFQFPYALTTDAAGNVFVADTFNHTIRKITTAGVVSTFAGSPGIAGATDGAAANALFNKPTGISLDGSGNLYVTDTDSGVVRKLAVDGTVTTLMANRGAITDALVDSDGNLFVAGAGSQTVSKYLPEGLIEMGSMAVQGAADGPEDIARFNLPVGIAIDASGTLYIADQRNQTIRKGTRVTVTWPTPAAIASGTPISATQLNATANVDGTMRYSVAPGQFLAVGQNQLTVSFTPTGGSSRTTVTAAVTLTVVGGAPVLSWMSPAPIEYGTALTAAQLNATANVPGTFTYDPPSGTVLPVGQHRLQVTFSPTDSTLYSSSTAEVYLVVSAGASSSIPVLTQPSNQSVAAGSNATFTFAVSSTQAIAYSWLESTDGGGTWNRLSDNGRYFGTNTGTLTVTPTIAMNGYQYRGYASAPGAWQWSNPATLSVTGAVAYLGGYFGTFGHGGSWSLFVGSPSRFIGYLPGTRAAIIQTLTVPADGAFSVPCEEQLAGGAAGRTLTLRGRITAPSEAQRSVTAELVEAGETLSGSFPTTGALTSFSGDFFTANALGTIEGNLYVTVGYGGEIQAVIVMADLVDGARGNITAAGTATLTTEAGHSLAVTIDPSTRTVKATLTRAQPANSGTRRILAVLPATIEFAGIAQSVSSTARFADIATRAYCRSGNGVTIGGFVVTGNEAKQVLIRAVGPTLASQGIAPSELLADPTVEVHDAKHGNVVIATNDNWVDEANAAEFTATGIRVGAAALLDSDRSSSGLLLTLQPGVYSFVVRGKNATSGIVLLEVYDASLATAGTKFVNIATRAYASTGNAVAIGGFVVSGNAPKHLLLRAVGSTLTTMGIGTDEVLADPTIEVHDALHGNVVIATNDDWAENGNSAAILATAARVGASPIDVADSKSSALLLTLRPGVYSFVASGRDGTSGIVLVEAYDAD